MSLAGLSATAFADDRAPGDEGIGEEANGAGDGLGLTSSAVGVASDGGSVILEATGGAGGRGTSATAPAWISRAAVGAAVEAAGASAGRAMSPGAGSGGAAGRRDCVIPSPSPGASAASDRPLVATMGSTRFT